MGIAQRLKTLPMGRRPACAPEDPRKQDGDRADLGVCQVLFIDFGFILSMSSRTGEVTGDAA